MDSVHFYQPPATAGLRSDGRPTVSNLHVPTVCGKGKKASESLQDFHLIEFLDMTGPPPKESTDPLHMSAQNLCAEKDAGDTSNKPNSTRRNGRTGGEEDDDFPTFEGLLLGAGKAQEEQRTGSSDGHPTGGSEGNFEHTAKDDRNSAGSPRASENKNEEKLMAAGDNRSEDCDAPDAQREAGGSIHVETCNDLTADGEDEKKEAVRPDQSIATHGTHNDDTDTAWFAALRNKPKPIFRYPPGLGPKDRNTCASSTLDKPGSPGDPIVIQDQGIDSSGDGTSEEQDGNQGTLSTPPTSVTGSEDGIPSPTKKNKHSTSKKPLPHRNTIVSSKYDKPVREFKGGNRQGLMLDPLTNGDKKDPCNGQEAEVDDKEEDKEKPNGNGDKKTTPLLQSIKKRSLSAVEGKSASKRHIKRRRFLSPHQNEAAGSQENIFAVQHQHLDTQANSTSPESKGVNPEIRNATIPPGPTGGTITSLPIVEQVQGQGDAAQVEEPEWEIIKILDKRETVSGTEYMVRWKNTWLRKGELGNAQKLLRQFEANGRPQYGRKRGRPTRTCKVW